MSFSRIVLIGSMVTATCFFSSASISQESIETELNVKIEGVATRIYGFNVPFVWSPEMLPMDFALSISQDPTEKQQVVGTGDEVAFTHVALSVELEVYDAEGEVVFDYSHSTEFPRSNSCGYNDVTPVTYRQGDTIVLESPDDVAISDGLQLCLETGDYTSLLKTMMIYAGVYPSWYYGPDSPIEEELLLSGPARSLFQVNPQGYPEFVLGETAQAFEFYIQQTDYGNDGGFGGFSTLNAPSEPSGAIDVEMQGYLTRVSALINDADDDGIADEVDQCSASLLAETVSFDGIDSGVTNVVDANGCSIMDHYAACETEQTSSGFLGYSGASYCEQQVAYQLYRDGLIDYMDVRALRNALN